MDASSSTSQATAIGNGGNKPQVGEIVIHGFAHNERWLLILPIAKLFGGVFNGHLYTTDRE